MRGNQGAPLGSEGFQALPWRLYHRPPSRVIVDNPNIWVELQVSPKSIQGTAPFDESHELEYIGGMKVKTSVTLSEDLVEAIDKRSGLFKNRSDFIEAAVRAFIAQMIRAEQNAKDLAIINQRADRLNQEAADVPEYQVAL